MFGSVGKLFCATALASVALAQSVYFIQPASGAAISAGASLTVELAREQATDTTELGLAIGALSCTGGVCPGEDTLKNSLGTVIYAGTYTQQSTNSSGYGFDTFSVTVPTYFNGPVEISLARFYLNGTYGASYEQYASVTIEVSNGQG